MHALYYFYLQYVVRFCISRRVWTSFLCSKNCIEQFDYSFWIEVQPKSKINALRSENIIKQTVWNNGCDYNSDGFLISTVKMT